MYVLFVFYIFCFIKYKRSKFKIAMILWQVDLSVKMEWGKNSWYLYCENFLGLCQYPTDWKILGQVLQGPLYINLSGLCFWEQNPVVLGASLPQAPQKEQDVVAWLGSNPFEWFYLNIFNLPPAVESELSF